MGAIEALFEPGGLLHSPIPLHLRVTDVVTSLALASAGLYGLLAFRRHRGDEEIRYWLLAGLGMLYLALDEAQSVHERTGKWLWRQGWEAPPPFSHNDDALLFMIALAGIGVTAVYFRALLARPPAARLLFAGMATTGSVLVLDTFAALIYVEEALELGAAFLLAAAFQARFLSRPALEDIASTALVAVEVREPSRWRPRR